MGRNRGFSQRISLLYSSGLRSLQQEHERNYLLSLCQSGYSSVDGVLFNKKQTMLLLYPPAKEGASCTVPQTAEALCDYAFCPTFYYKPVPRKYLKTVILPPNLHTIANPNSELYHDEVGTKEERIKAAFQDLLFNVQKDSAAHKELARYDLNYEFI